MEISDIASIWQAVDRLESALKSGERASCVSGRLPVSKSRSTAVVNCLMEIDSAVRKTGFRKALTDVFPKASANFIPDAYAIRPADKLIDLIEVVDTNPIMRAKASRIASLADHVAQRGWQVVVVGFDSCGGKLFEISGMCFFPAFLQPHMGSDTGNAIPAALAVNRQFAN